MSNWSNIDGAALDRWLTTPPEDDDEGDEAQDGPICPVCIRDGKGTR